MALTIFLIIFAVSFALGYPIAFGMLAAGIVYLMIKGLSLANVLDMMVIGLSNQTVLIAVPLFILAANIMNDTEITNRLFDFVRKAFGRVRGSFGLCERCCECHLRGYDRFTACRRCWTWKNRDQSYDGYWL